MKHLDKFLPRALPSKYGWVEGHAKRNGPNLVREALKNYGLKEIPGHNHAPEILEMAETLGGVIADFYNRDEIPWCALAVSYWIMKANFDPLKNYAQVRARDYAQWGNKADNPSFGDVMVFWRGSRSGRDGHVGLYIMEDASTYHILGGNQGNEVNIKRLSKNRLLAARRCPWRIAQPRGVKPIFISNVAGDISENEA